MFKLFKKSKVQEKNPALDTESTNESTFEEATLGEVSENEESQVENEIEEEPGCPAVTKEEVSPPELQIPENTDEPSMTELFGEWLAREVPDEEVSAAASKAMETLLADVEQGNDLTFLFELVLRGADYERAVSAAAIEGEIRGRNQRIEEEQALCFADDGVPHPCSGGIGPDVTTPGIFRIAQGARF